MIDRRRDRDRTLQRKSYSFYKNNEIFILISSYLHVIGKNVWRKWKRRYMVLVQVSQYTFALCSYKDKKSEPAEMMQLDGFTVDYIELASGEITLSCGTMTLSSFYANFYGV